MRLAREQSKQSVVQVLDPQVYLRSVKKHLSEKQGLPAEHQRLTFAVAAALGKAEDPAPLPGTAEGLLSGLDTWQALVYCNKKCVGKFTQPRLYSVSHLGDASSVSSSESCPVQQLTIIYDCFKAASSDSSARVSVPVVASSSSQEYRFTVVGRCEGRNFILPATYHFSSQQAAYELQKALYTSRHRQSQAAAATFVTALSPLITTTDLTLNFGRGLELFSAVFEPQADSAWLKCLILKFGLVAQSSLHEAGPSLSSSESLEPVTPQQDQQSEANSRATPSSKMPSTNHKPLSKKQKQKQNSRAALLANRHADSPKSAASTASKDIKEDRTASVHSNNQHPPKKLMAVPAVSEDQAAAVNGFSTSGALVTPSSEGLQSNGWAPTESGSSLAGSCTSAVASWQPAAPQQPTATSKPASDSSLDLQNLSNEGVNHTQSQPRHALPSGWHSGTPSASVAVSLASAGDTETSPMDARGGHLGVQGVGMYAEPAAVQAWATYGAASAAQEKDTPASSSHSMQYRRSRLPDAQQHVNGYASGVYPGNPSGGRLGDINPSLHPYPGSSSSDHHWQESTPELPPGLFQGSARPGSNEASLALAARQVTAGRNQAPASHMGLPSYALPVHAKQAKSQQGSMHAQPTHLGWPQSRQPAAGVSARPTSSLQSLDLAHDSWQEGKSGQSQHPYGQRWGKGSRPSAHGGGSATQPSSARVSPERSRDGHRTEAPQRQGSASGAAAQRPVMSAGSRHGEYPHASIAPDAFAESGLCSRSALQRQGSAFHARTAAQLPREAAEAAVPASASMADSQRPVMTDWHRPAPLQRRDLAAATDIERLLQQLTPAMPGGSQARDRLTLGHLWQWYLEPSLYGTEIVTLGGSRGPSVSYYVPYLSAMQLLLPLAPAATAPHAPQQEPIGMSSASQSPGQPAQLSSSQQPTVAQHSSSQLGRGDDAVQQMHEGVRSQQPAGVCHDSADSRPSRVYHTENDGQVQPLIELFDTELPFNRVPMHDRVQELAAGRLANGMPGSTLNSQLISELHPASWFSVAWYPAYRIPDAPLNGRFLTFHHLAPRPAPGSTQPGLSPDMFSTARNPSLQADPRTHPAGSPVQTLDLPIAGLKLCNLHGERWLEPLSMDPSQDASSQLRSSHRGESVSSPPPMLQHRLNALQQHAQYLARAQGLRLQGPEGLERLQQRHPDFEFFHTRH